MKHIIKRNIWHNVDHKIAQETEFDWLHVFERHSWSDAFNVFNVFNAFDTFDVPTAFDIFNVPNAFDIFDLLNAFDIFNVMSNVPNVVDIFNVFNAFNVSKGLHKIDEYKNGCTMGEDIVMVQNGMCMVCVWYMYSMCISIAPIKIKRVWDNAVTLPITHPCSQEYSHATRQTPMQSGI